LRATVALSLIAAVAAAAPATAEAPAPPTGNYGGGAVVAPPKTIYGAGNMLIGLRATSDGKLTINAAVILSCTQDAVIRAEFQPAADGSFGGRGTRTRRIAGGGRVETDYRISGTIAGAAVNGKISANNDIIRGGVRKRCPRSVVVWSARRATGETGAPPIPPNARLHGTTSQRLGGPRRAITLRVSADGAKLTRALYEVTVKCGSRAITDTYDAPKRNLPIAADGTVRDVERFTFRTRDTIYRSVERFEATLGAAGAHGTFSTTARLASRATGRTLGRCRSGTVRWSAAP